VFLSVSIIAAPEGLVGRCRARAPRRQLLPTPSLATTMSSKMAVNCF
jgi:hypothetical protein